MNNYAFNPNPRINRPNLVNNCNSTGNVKNHKDTIKNDTTNFYNKMAVYNRISQLIDYRLSSIDKAKKLCKIKK